MDLLMLPDRIREKIEVVGDCWHWTGCILQSGYGQAWSIDQKKGVRAHLFVYGLLVGPVPARPLEADHECHTDDETCLGGPSCIHRRCVNPAHISFVTPKVNAERRSARITHCPQGHPYKGHNLIIHDGRRSCRTCKNDRDSIYRGKTR